MAIISFASPSSSLVVLVALLAATASTAEPLPTVTVRGFLNFRTTVDGTVIVFTPASAAPAPAHSAPIGGSVPPPAVSSSRISPSSSIRPFVSSSATAWISPTVTSSRWRQVSQTVAVPSSSFVHHHHHHQRPVSSFERPVLSSSVVYPTGLVTVMADTMVHDGVTTVHETSVLGTYIEGKYAQILRSSSKVTGGDLRPSLAEGLIPGIFPTRTFDNFPLPSSSLVAPPVSRTPPKAPLDETPPKRPSFDGGTNAIQAAFRTADRAAASVASATATRSHTRRERPRLPWEKKKDTSSPHDAPNTTERPQKATRRPARPGAVIRSGRFAWTPRQTDRVRLNRFKVNVATNKDKEEGEAAKELNQRLARRLGITKPPPELRTTEKPPTSVAADESRFAVYNAPLLEGVIGGDFNEEALSRPGPDGEPPLLNIDPHRVVTEVQTVTSEFTRDVAGHVKVDTVTFTTTVERTLHPTESYPTDGIIGGTVAVDANDLDASTIQETPPIVISRTYSVTERSTRTSLVPVFDGTSTTTHTVTERFLIRKLITGDLLLLETAMSNMNASDFLDNLTEAEQSTSQIFHTGVLNLDAPTATNHQGLPHGTELFQLQPSIQSPFAPSIDLNNPLVLSAALQNPALAAMYFGLQQLGQQATQLTTLTKPTEYLTTETVFNTKVISFYDGRQTRTRTLTEPGATISRTVTTTVTEVSSVVNPQILVQQAQLQRAFVSQLSSVVGPQVRPTTVHDQSQQFNPYNHFNQNQNFQNQNFQNQNYQNQNYQNNQNPNFQNQNNQNFQNQNNQFNPNQFNLNPFNQQFNQAQAQQTTLVSSPVTTVIMTTSTNTKVYTLVYNAQSTRFRTVTSTSVYPTTVTTIMTQTISATQNPFAFFG